MHPRRQHHYKNKLVIMTANLCRDCSVRSVKQMGKPIFSGRKESSLIFIRNMFPLSGNQNFQGRAPPNIIRSLMFHPKSIWKILAVYEHLKMLTKEKGQGKLKRKNEMNGSRENLLKTYY